MEKWTIIGMVKLQLNPQIRVWRKLKILVWASFFRYCNETLNWWNLSHPSSDTGCECSSNSSCHISLSPDCNCNSFLPNSSDRGIIYSLSKLPIMNLNYGGSISPYSFINFKLGPMVCSGKSTFYPSETADAERKQLKDFFILYRLLVYSRDSTLYLI